MSFTQVSTNTPKDSRDYIYGIHKETHKKMCDIGQMCLSGALFGFSVALVIVTSPLALLGAAIGAAVGAIFCALEQREYSKVKILSGFMVGALIGSLGSLALIAVAKDSLDKAMFSMKVQTR